MGIGRSERRWFRGFASACCLLGSLAAAGPGLTWLAMPSARADDEPTIEGASLPSQARYPHRSVRRSEFGQGGKAYWLFEPAEPKPRSAPVVVLNHGWLAVNPGAYGAWISHLARSGNIVIFPRYQGATLTPPRDFLPNAIAAVHDALEVLDTGRGRVRPDLTKFALLGHSAGANLAAQMAAVAEENHLPTPRAVIAMMPGEVRPFREPNLGKIPSKTLLVVAVAENDRVVGDARGRQIFAEASAIPPSRKLFIFYRTDLHGIPRLVAHHLAPTAAHSEFDSGDGLFMGFQRNKAEVNAFDHAGFWNLADLTLKAAFQGKTLADISKRGELFRNLGYWSDGRAVKRPIVSNDLSRIPRVVPNNGIRIFDFSVRPAKSKSSDDLDEEEPAEVEETAARRSRP